MKRTLFMDPGSLARRFGVLLAVVAALASVLLAGCMTVPPGLPQAMAAPETVLDAAARDQASELAEQKAFFDKLSAAEKNRLLEEQFNWTVQELDRATTESLRPRFVVRSIETEAKIAEFDKPLALWQARGKEREAQIRDAIRMNRETLAALRYAAIGTTPAPAPATTTATTGGK